MELSDVILDNNEFCFEGERYLQVEGTAIGSKLGKNYACSYMGKWEEEVVAKGRKDLKKAPKAWFRFVDDIWGVWKGTKEEFGKFVDICNSHEQRIKITWEVCEDRAIFLDVMVVRMEMGELKTELYVKPSDRTRYLHVESDHPKHVKEGIAKGQARRLRRICSTDEDYWKYGEGVRRKLTSRGYGANYVKRHLKEGADMDRQEALKRVEKKMDNRLNFVTTYSSYLPNVNEILKRHGHYLEEDGLGEYVKEVPRLSLRRGKNLADLVVAAKPRKQAGCSGPCGRECMLCSIMLKTGTVKDKDGKMLVINGQMDCRTVGVIYGIFCIRCERIIYVGKTMNRAMERFNRHRMDLRREADPSKPVYHFKRDGHKDEDMRVVLLEEVKGDDDTYRLVRERWWTNRLGTYNEENKKK